MPKKRANGEGSLRKRKDGRWEGRYTAGCDPTTGMPIHKNVLAKTQSEAKEKLKQAIAEAEKLDMSRAKSYTLGAWIKLWYEVYAEPRLREKTKDYYLNYIDNHIVPELGNTPLEKLTTIQIQKFYNDLQKSQGFDLETCCGKQVTRYTYTVTNYPQRPDGVQLNLYICEDLPVAGDVVCTGTDGFQDTLVFPQQTDAS